MSEIPSHVQHFGRFMDESAEKAATKGLTPRDLLKAYAITRASIGRGALPRKTLEANGWQVPEGVDSLRPEGAMGEWLHTPMGQEYLHHAERGRVHEGAIADAVRKFRPFGKQNDTEGKALAWAAHNLPGMEGHVSKMVQASRHKDANPTLWRHFIKTVPGVNIAKAGFLGSMLGMGNQPTLDARQLILNTGRPTSEAAKPMSRVGGAEEAVDRLAARQKALQLGIPEDLEPYYQHLAHHAIWDKSAGEQTTHADLMHAMRYAAKGGSIIKTSGGTWPDLGSHELARSMHAVFGGAGGLGGLWKGASDQNVREQLLNTPDYANPNPELVKKALALAQKTHGVNQTFDSKSGMSYSNFKGGTRPISDVTSTVEPIPGVTPKPVKQLDWQDFIRKNKGASLINVGGDRSRLGRLTHINDKALGWPVDLHAGPDYMREPNKGAVWANAQSNASGFANTVKKLGEHGKVFGVYKPMGPQSVDSSRQMSDALMSQIAAQPLDPKVAQELDAELKKGAHEPDAAARAKAVASMENWPGFSNPREARDHLLKLPGTARSLVVKHLDKAGWHAKGVPHIGHTRVALTDPAALTTPGHMLGHRIVELTGGHPEASAFEHNTYPVPTGGRYVGDVPNVLAHYAMPEVQRGFALKHHAAGMTHPLSEAAGARSSFIKMMGEQKNVQPINEEMAQGVGHAQEVQQGLKQAGVPGYAEGGVVDKALAMTAPRALTPSGLYSQAGDAAAALPQAKGSPQQMIASMKGVKPEELAHANPMGKFGDQKSVTRDQLAGHMRFNLPRINETTHSDDDIDEDDEGERAGGPKYEEYSIPGGQNYRELVMHTPKTPTPPATPEMQAALKHQNDTYWAANGWHMRNQYALDKDNPEKMAEYKTLHDAQTAAQRHYSQLQQEHVAKAKAKDYHSSHWDEPNVLAHLRMSDRKLPNGEKALHLEELQSDWGQGAREHGVRGAEPEPDWQKNLEEMRSRRGKEGFADPAEEARFQKLHKHEWAVPAGPHIGSTNGWTDLGLKRALIEAARGGHDRLAWTPGEEHADRYGMQKHFSEIRYEPSRKHLYAFQHAGAGASPQEVEPDQLHQYVGRDLANRLLSTEPKSGAHVLTGDDLRGGGEGMKAYYDKLVPTRLKEILKKLGHEADFEPVTIKHPSKHGDDAQTTLHSVKLPKELREKIKKGLPAFSTGGDVDMVNRALRVTAKPAKLHAQRALGS
jgi:hypothetical protein